MGGDYARVCVFTYIIIYLFAACAVNETKLARDIHAFIKSMKWILLAAYILHTWHRTVQHMVRH